MKPKPTHRIGDRLAVYRPKDPVNVIRRQARDLSQPCQIDAVVQMRRERRAHPFETVCIRAGRHSFVHAVVRGTVLIRVAELRRFQSHSRNRHTARPQPGRDESWVSSFEQREARKGRSVDLFSSATTVATPLRPALAKALAGTWLDASWHK
jgi:hypothetical protein